MNTNQIRAFSYGGGVQSNAALALSAVVAAGCRDGLTEAEIAARLRALIGRPVDLPDNVLIAAVDFPVYLFSNVGEDSEHPATLSYVRDHGRPYAEAHGLEFVELHRVFVKGVRSGATESLLQRIARDDRTIGIPMRLDRTAAPGRRQCTRDFKVEVINRELKRRGAHRPIAWERQEKTDKKGKKILRKTATEFTPRAIMGLGISLDEITRMSSDDPDLVSIKAYPLIDLRLTRQDCLNIIERAGLPVPPKSSCWFCPFHSLQTWREMRDNEPDLFQQAVALEQMLNTRGKNLSTGPVWMTRYRIPLDQVVGSAVQADLWADELDVCETGHCMV